MCVWVRFGFGLAGVRVGRRFGYFAVFRVCIQGGCLTSELDLFGLFWVMWLVGGWRGLDLLLALFNYLRK